MHRFMLLIGLALLGLGIGSLASGQNESRPHLELVRGLRKDNMSDLALQYLEELKTKNRDPQIAIILPLEFARTYTDLAGDENDAGKRNLLLANAKKELETFLKANPAHDLAPQANVELARIYSVQGRTQLRKAKRSEDKMDQEVEMRAARPMLQIAADKYLETAKLIDAQIKQLESAKDGNEKKLRDLNDFRITAQLDQGITVFYLGETYTGEEAKDVSTRGKQFNASRKIFEKIMYENEKLPLCWTARAWFAQAAYKEGDTGVAEKEFDNLMKKKADPVATAGVRVGRYFQILNTFDDSGKDALTKFQKLEKDTGDWLRDYAPYRESAEGLGARFYLALAKRALAMPGVQFDKKEKKISGITNASKIRFEDAARLLKDLADGENEYSDRANRSRSMILVTLADAEGRGDDPPLESLTSFERAYLVAQVQVARFVQYKNNLLNPPPPPEEESKKDDPPPKKGVVPKKVEPKKEEPKPEDDPEKLEAMIKKEEIRRFNNAIRYAQHALTLVNPKDNLRDVFAAQLFMIACYSQLKLYPQAAVLAEYVARENPKMGKAATAGSVAVQCYNLAQIELRKLKEKTEQADERIWDAKFKADTDRLRGSAAFMIKQWPAEAASDEARHILAYFIARDKKYPEAWKVYADIRPSYPALQVARLELASVMFTMIYPTDEKDRTKFDQIVKDRLKQYASEWKQTIELLETVPAADEAAIVQDAFAYVDNRTQLARMYQLEGSQAKAQKIAEDLLKRIPLYAKLKEEQKANALLGAQTLWLGTIRSQAYDEFKKGNHAKVAELLDPRVEEIGKEFDKKTPDEPTLAFSRLRRAQRDTVVLALQSGVQDGKIKRAGDLLKLLEKSGGTIEENMGLLQGLVSNIRTQIEELTAEKKDAEAKALKTGFTELLENIITDQGDKMSIKMKLFLAQGLSSVESYTKAAELLDAVRKVPQPVEPVELTDKATPEQQDKFKRDKVEFQGYATYMKQAQYLAARNYRSAKEYPKSLAIFDEMIGPITAKAFILPKERQKWAYASLSVRKEKAMMMEEIALNAPKTERVAKWVAAVQEWVYIQKTFASQLVPLMQELSPEDKARKLLATLFMAKPDAAGSTFSFVDMAWLGHQFGPILADERQKAAAAATTNATKRGTYFDLFFEQKRCSVKAFQYLGTDATGGDKQKLDDKFVSFAKEFVDLQSPIKNPDLSQTIKDRIKELVASTPELKVEYQKLRPGN